MSSNHAPVRVWYEQVTLSDDTPYTLLLDGRMARTGSAVPLAHSSYPLMQQIQREWQKQDTFLVLHTLPLTRLLSGLVEMNDEAHARFVEELLGYSQHELLCYHADAHTPLAKEQQRLWMPWLEWGAQIYGYTWNTTHSLMPITQPNALTDSVERSIKMFSHAELLCHSILTQLLGSFLLADALMRGVCTPEEALACAWLEQDTHTKQWGEDKESTEQRIMVADQMRDVLMFYGFIGSV